MQFRLSKRLSLSVCSLSILMALGQGCGSEAPLPEEHHSDRTASSGGEHPHHSSAGPQITGLMGTIEPSAVEGPLNSRMGRFMRCFQRRMADVEFLAGNIRMSFRIHVDGTVAWVYPAESDLGDRAAEQCVLDVARAVRFPEPHGGEAEFSWGFGFDAAEDIRPPLNWGPEAVSDLDDRSEALRRACDVHGQFSVTAYVQPGGQVLSAGGTMSTADDEQTLECILTEVRGWELPDPGSYAAKVTFPIQ